MFTVHLSMPQFHATLSLMDKRTFACFLWHFNLGNWSHPFWIRYWSHSSLCWYWSRQTEIREMSRSSSSIFHFLLLPTSPSNDQAWYYHCCLKRLLLTLSCLQSLCLLLRTFLAYYYYPLFCTFSQFFLTFITGFDYFGTSIHQFWKWPTYFYYLFCLINLNCISHLFTI